MRNKIKEGLKTEFVNLGLGEKAFDGVADYLLASKTITEESQIATAIKGAEIKGLLTAIQAETDRLRNDKTTLQQQLDAYKLAHPEVPNPPIPPAPPTPPVDPPAPGADFIKTLTDLINPLKEEIQGIKKEKELGTKLQDAEKLWTGLGISPAQKQWAELSWKQATTAILDADTPQAIADRAKAQFDTYMTMSGANGYVPATGSGGADKSHASKIVAEIVEKQKLKATETQSVEDRFLGKAEK